MSQQSLIGTDGFSWKYIMEYDNCPLSNENSLLHYKMLIMNLNFQATCILYFHINIYAKQNVQNEYHHSFLNYVSDNRE